MTFVDPLLTIGRSNGALTSCPRTETELLRVMDRYDVREGMVMHTVSRDSDPELGNKALGSISDSRLHRIWGFDPAAAIPESSVEFLARALRNGAKAILVNPCARAIRLTKEPRIGDLAEAMAERQIPLLVLHRQWDSGQDLCDWYDLADFCRTHPKLPVIAWEWRARANRPMFDALAETDKLAVSLSSIWQAQMVEAICATFGPERLVFSLGLPSLDPGSFQAVVRYAGISDAERELVAGENVMRLLGEANYEL